MSDRIFGKEINRKISRQELMTSKVPSSFNQIIARSLKAEVRAKFPSCADCVELLLTENKDIANDSTTVKVSCRKSRTLRACPHIEVAPPVLRGSGIDRVWLDEVSDFDPSHLERVLKSAIPPMTSKDTPKTVDHNAW